MRHNRGVVVGDAPRGPAPIPIAVATVPLRSSASSGPTSAWKSHEGVGATS